MCRDRDACQLNWLGSNELRIDSLLLLSLVVRRELIEELTIHLHERFEHVVDEGNDRLVPVLLRDAVQCREHYGKDHIRVLLDQTHDVFIVPVVQRPFSHLQQVRVLYSSAHNKYFYSASYNKYYCTHSSITSTSTVLIHS